MERCHLQADHSEDLCEIRHGPGGSIHTGRFRGVPYKEPKNKAKKMSKSNIGYWIFVAWTIAVVVASIVYRKELHDWYYG